MITNLINLAKEKDIKLEVCTFSENDYSVETLNDELIKFNITKQNEYTIKALYNDKVINIVTEKIDNPDEIINKIINNAKLIDNDNKNRLCENDFEVESREYKEIDFNNIKEELFKLNKEYHDKYPFIINIDMGVDYDVIERIIDNDKHHMKDKYASLYMFASISGKKNDVVKSQVVSIYDKEFNLNRVKDEFDKAIKKLEDLFNATSIKTDKYKVLIDNYVINKIIYTFANSFYEKSLDMKVSPFAGKLGKKIFSDKITIMEEPVNEKFVVNKHFDQEGSLTYNKEIIKDGVFKTAFNTLEYAIKNNTKPTGNANMICNLNIKPGNLSYDELVKSMDNGVIINNVEGLHAGINTSTGDISLQSTGYLVDKGKKVKALDMIILQTNIFELLSNVIEVGNDFKEFSMYCAAVSLLLSDITISGNL